MKLIRHNRTRGVAIGLLFLMLLGLASTLALAEQKTVSDDAPLAGDPFAFRGMETDSDGFVSVTSAAMPAGIRVVGILTPHEGKAVGVLDIPGTASLHFIREGDTIQIDPMPPTHRPSPMRADRRTGDSRVHTGADQQTTTPTPQSPIYLLIVSISENQIEIAPRARPQDTRIYR